MRSFPMSPIADRAVLHALIGAHPLGTWVTAGDVGLVANHIPFLVDASRGEHGTLVAHVARANPIWRTFSTTTPSLVVFQGAEAYISPSWYPTKREHGKVETQTSQPTNEVGGRGGLDPTRYGDWEINGLASDF